MVRNRISYAPSTGGRVNKQQDDRRSAITIVLGLVFGTILVVMVLQGGMCERYERRMQRQRLMQEYLNSQRK